MAYEKVKWADQVVERPRTYTVTNNPDGSITLTPAPGEVVKIGTPLDAAHFGRSEEGLAEYAAAIDWMATILDAMDSEVQLMREQLDALVN